MFFIGSYDVPIIYPVHS